MNLEGLERRGFFNSGRMVNAWYLPITRTYRIGDRRIEVRMEFVQELGDGMPPLLNGGRFTAEVRAGISIVPSRFSAVLARSVDDAFLKILEQAIGRSVTVAELAVSALLEPLGQETGP